MFFPIIYGIILPIDFHIFQDGFRVPKANPRIGQIIIELSKKNPTCRPPPPLKIWRWFKMKHLNIFETCFLYVDLFWRCWIADWLWKSFEGKVWDLNVNLKMRRRVSSDLIKPIYWDGKGRQVHECVSFQLRRRLFLLLVTWFAFPFFLGSKTIHGFAAQLERQGIQRARHLWVVLCGFQIAKRVCPTIPRLGDIPKIRAPSWSNHHVCGRAISWIRLDALDRHEENYNPNLATLHFLSTFLYTWDAFFGTYFFAAKWRCQPSQLFTKVWFVYLIQQWQCLPPGPA